MGKKDLRGGGGRLQHLGYRTGLLSVPILREWGERLELVKWGWFCKWLIKRELEEKINFKLL